MITRREFFPAIAGGLGVTSTTLRNLNPLHLVFHAKGSYDPRFDSPFQAILNATVRIKRYTYLEDGNAIIGIGTGFVYKETKDGYFICTNYHVVRNHERVGIVDEKVSILLEDNTLIPVEVVKANSKLDIAVLISSQSELEEKVLPTNYPYLQWGNADLKKDDKLLIVGYQDGAILEVNIGYVVIPEKEDNENGYDHKDVWFLSTGKRGNSGASVLKEVKHPQFGVVYEFVGIFHSTKIWSPIDPEATTLEDNIVQTLRREKQEDAIHRSRAVLYSEFQSMLS